MSIEKELKTTLRSRFDGASKRSTLQTTYEPPKIPSWRDSKRTVNRVNTNVCLTTKNEPQLYTGDLVRGVALIHKSCYQPIISKEAAIDVARMRR
jgi:hypothetical protein